MLSLREHREPTSRLPDHLPWAAIVAPGIVLQKNAILQRTLSFRGRDLASSSPEELMSSVARLNNALKRLGSGWALFVEAQRRIATEYPASTWTETAPWLVDLERRHNFQQGGTRFESLYYLTFAWQLPADHHSRLQTLFYDDPELRRPNEQTDRDLAEFSRTVAELADIMRSVFADLSELDNDETLTYLHSTISTNRHPVRMPETPMYLDGVLTDVAFTPGDVPLLGDHYIPTCTIAGFPSTTLPGILDGLNHLAIEYRWVTRFICLDKQEARVELERFRRGWWQKRKTLLTMLKEEATKQESSLLDNAAALKAQDADAALQTLGEDIASYGYVTATLTVSDPNLLEARRKMQAAKQVIQSRGFVVRDETLNSREAWFGSLPGHVTPNVRRPIINTINLAHILPISAVWAGDTRNEHLHATTGVGTSHVYCSTTGATPFRLNLAVGDVGHTLIVGPTGAGKSTLLALLALQWRRYPNSQVIIFDKDRSARAATSAVGGGIYEPGNDRTPLSFQPLADIDVRSERLWAAQFVLNLLTAQHVPETPDLKATIDRVVRQLAELDHEHRTLSVFTGMLPPDLSAALRPYTHNGNFGHIFDGNRDEIGSSSTWQMFEMGALMALGEAAVVPALDYLFHRAELRFDGRPTLLVLDEAWLFLKHEVFASRLQDWLKTLRKKNVYVVCATQEIADATNSPILDTILSACPTKIYLPNDEALTPHMAKAYGQFGLSPTELSILAQAQKKRDYYYRSPRGRRLFTLDLGPIALAFTGMSSPDDHRFLDSIPESTPGTDAAELILRHRGLPWAADLIRNPGPGQLTS
jgi:type IV secretion/conjugal transfer VirB4 family ATPase